MPVPLPDLDDRTYAELVAEARALIPSLDPGWTNHNPSDPGIVVVELLAWLTEMLLFQVNEVPPESIEAFLSLLNGPGWSRDPGDTLDEATVRTMGYVRERYRAVTAGDYEHLTMRVWPSTEKAVALGDRARVARVRCVPQRNLAAPTEQARTAPAPAHVSLVVVPERPLAPVVPAAPGSTPAKAATAGDSAALAFAQTHPSPGLALRAGLGEFFAPRRTLATRLHVVAPVYAPVSIGASLGLVDDAPPDDAVAQARAALAAFFDPFVGGPEATGWPFGRDVHASEVYAVLEKVPLIDHIDDVRVTGSRPLLDSAGVTVGAALDAHELVALGRSDLIAFDANGKRYDPPPTAGSPPAPVPGAILPTTPAAIAIAANLAVAFPAGVPTGFPFNPTPFGDATLPWMKDNT